MQASLELTQQQLLEYLRSEKSAVLLGLDLGGRKVGVAKAALPLKICIPLSVLEYKTAADLSLKLKALIKENSASALVIGLPKADESTHKRFSSFINDMQLGLPYTFEDESYTSIIADELLKQVGMKRKHRNMHDDKLSAKLILDTFITKL